VHDNVTRHLILRATSTVSPVAFMIRISALLASIAKQSASEPTMRLWNAIPETLHAILEWSGTPPQPS